MNVYTLTLFEGLGPRPEWVTAASSAWAYTLVVGAAFVVSVIWCLVYVVRQRDVLPLVMLLGGVISMGLEPTVDTLGKVWYAKDNPWVVYVGMGVPQPAFLLMGYSLFWGGAVYIASRLVRNGLSIYKVFAGVFVVDLIVEYLGVSVLGVGLYYDFSPFRVMGFPLWWAFVNAAAAVIGVWLVLVLEPRLTGWRRLGFLVVPATAFGTTHAACSWAVWLTLHSDAPHWLANLAGLYAIAMSFGLTAFVASELRDRRQLTDGSSTYSANTLSSSVSGVSPRSK
ncbi:hypothetical protein H7J93_14470 [Mycobacterium barrassiae]|uniref:hypothetical protein n=1 Tax=Mycobacterium barrassiae TaxID=319709 RepID=UPI00226580CF|nr:hypothetical protein [Mycobacterium barrassiae]MCV7300833.1 hypothetical protein [Mycobacterium barrassiae]